MEQYVGIRSKPNVSFLLHMANVDTHIYTPHIGSGEHSFWVIMSHPVRHTHEHDVCTHTQLYLSLSYMSDTLTYVHTHAL